MDSRSDIARTLDAHGGILDVAIHRHLERSARWLSRSGELVRILPGAYVDPTRASDPRVLMRAVVSRHPGAIIIGPAAAWLTFWPEVTLGPIQVSYSTEIKQQPGYVFTRRRIPPELVIDVHGLRVSHPALTAIDLALSGQAEAIDIALDARATTLTELREALRLTPARPGNNERRAALTAVQRRVSALDGSDQRGPP